MQIEILDFRHTCPEIDLAKDEMLNAVDTAIFEISKTLGDKEQAQELIDTQEEIRYMVERNIEELRALNAEMRDAADCQLKRLHDEAQDEIESLKDEIHELKSEIDELIAD